MPPERAELLLADGAFERLKPELQERSARIPLYFLDAPQLHRTAVAYLDSLEHERPAALQRADCRLQPCARPGEVLPPAPSSKVS